MERLDIPIFKPFVFQNEESTLASAAGDAAKKEEDSLSIKELLATVQQGKKFFTLDPSYSDFIQGKIKRRSDGNLAKQDVYRDSESDSDNDCDDKLFEIVIKPCSFQSKQSSLLVIRNVSHVVR